MASNALSAVMEGRCMGSVSDGGSVAMVLSGATIASCPSSLSTTSVQRGSCPGAQKGETRMDVRIGRVALRQDLYKPSALQIPLDVPLGAHQNAVTVQCPIHRYFAVV